MKISPAFPLYDEFDCVVPVYCLTPGKGGNIHRFFDTSPISPSGRYLATFRLPFEDRLPRPGEAGEIVLTDLETAEERTVAETCGWEPQMGANLQWLGSEDLLIYNDVDRQTWRPHAVVLDPITGESRRLDGCVYQASPDGRFAASARMSTMRRTQAGYGLVIPDEHCPINGYLPDDDGLYLTDTQTGKCELLVSIRQCFEEATPPIDVSEFKNWQFYGFHTKWSPQGDRLIFTVRWFEGLGKSCFNVLHQGGAMKYNVFTLRPDGTEIHNAVPYTEWDKGGHHINFFPDGTKLSMTLGFDEMDHMKFVQVGIDGTHLSKILDTVPGSGHPTLHPDGQHILTDTYVSEPLAFGDGTTPLRWIDRKQGTEQAIVRIRTDSPHRDALRVDPHPAWDSTWQYVAFNAFVDGTRRVYLADMRRLL
jgi:hypothetical protein